MIPTMPLGSVQKAIESDHTDGYITLMKVYRLLMVYMCMYNTIRSVMVLFHVDSQCTYTGILVILRACARGKAIGFVCHLSLSRKSLDLVFDAFMHAITTTNW